MDTIETAEVPQTGAVVLETTSREQLLANMEALEKDDQPATEEFPDLDPEEDPDAPPSDDEDEAPEPGDDWEDEHTPAKPADDPKAARIPRERLNKEIEKNRRLEAEISELRAGRQPEAQPQQRQQAAPGAVVPGDDQITAWARQNDQEFQAIEARIAEINAKPEMFPDQQAWYNAVADARGDRAAILRAHKVAIANQQTAHAQGQQQDVQQRLTRWNTAIENSTIPDIKAAAARLDSRASELHPLILQAITDAVDPAIATKAIMASPATFAWFADQSAKSRTTGQLSPAALMRLGELIALTKTPTAKAPATTSALTKAPASSAPPKGNVGAKSGAFWEKMADTDPVKYQGLLRAGKAPDIFGFKS